MDGFDKRGRIGDKIYYMYNGKQCVRSIPKHVDNPRTEAQQAHRKAFAEISKLSSYMKEAHLVGLHWKAVREKKSTYALFRSLNKDCLTSDGLINYPNVFVSFGSVARVDITAARVEDGVLTVTFDTRFKGGEDSDVFYLFVYCQDLREGHLATPVYRHAGVITAILPKEWIGRTLHLYAFLRDRRGRTSATIYHPLA